MKNKLLPFLLLVLLPLISFGAMRDAAVLTGSYVASDSINTERYNQISVVVTVAGTPEALSCNLVPQWSVDGIVWVSEPVFVEGTATSTEQPYTILDKRFDFSVNSSGIVFTETFNRWGGMRFFRVKVKESTGAGTTTATVKIDGYTAKDNQ